MSQMVAADRLDFQRGVQSEPLTEKDIETIHRYLSDPSVFPREFKQWITDHSSDTVDIAKTQVHGLVNNTGQIVIGSASMAILGATLCGCLMPFAATIAPDGWVLCDGRELVRTDYATLFNLIGTVWGSPSDGTKFKVPDLRGRTPFGADGNVPFAADDGIAAGARGPVHHHHFHAHADIYASGWNSFDGYTSYGGDHNHAVYYDVRQVYNIGDQPGNTVSGGGNATGTGGGGGHDHNAHVEGQVNVYGGVDIDNDTDGGGPANAGGWVGLNWIMGSGKLPG